MFTRRLLYLVGGVAVLVIGLAVYFGLSPLFSSYEWDE